MQKLHALLMPIMVIAVVKWLDSHPTFKLQLQTGTIRRKQNVRTFIPDERLTDVVNFLFFPITTHQAISVKRAASYKLMEPHGW